MTRDYPVPEDALVGKAERLGYVPSMGRSRERVKCCCGYVKDYYIWSWAGHGIAVCPGCGNRIVYGSLLVRKP